MLVLQYCVYALFLNNINLFVFFPPQTDALRLFDEREMLMRKLADSEAERRVCNLTPTIFAWVIRI